MGSSNVVKIYHYDYAMSRGRGDYLFRLVRPTENDIPWLDATRDLGWDQAEPLFPRQWQWIGSDDGEVREPVGEFSVASGPGEVLTPKAYAHLCHMLDGVWNHQFEIMIDGHVYHFVYRELLIKRRLGTAGVTAEQEAQLGLADIVSAGLTIPQMFRLSGRFERFHHGFCTEEFKEMVERNSLTGLGFEFFCEI